MTSDTLQRYKSPAELGNALKALREEAGHSLDYVSSETNIAVDVLKCLEEGRWERLGSKFLVKSFIRMYCQAIKTSPRPFIEAIENIDESYRRDYYFERLLQRKPRRIKNKSRLVFYATVVLISSLVVSGGVYLFHRSNRLPAPNPEAVHNFVPPLPEVTREEEAKEPQKSVLPSVGVVDRENSSLEALSQKGEIMSGNEGPPLASVMEKGERDVRAPELGNAETLQKVEDNSLRVKALEEAWVRIWVDEEKPVSRLLASGEELQFADAVKARLILGNAGGTEIIWHGEKLPPAGKRGQVVRLTLPDDIPRIKKQP
ncbi:helix-turn-helix domain-containing protein [Thermodesulforhabdus norvegica]|uniref:Protein RodZ, contains Xre-like HTH and DUF4115 domains n=1 Tax=Thermodesulforhabdus norvegica TaxID=39841 RepID=A0A1I4RIN4_9BACT|nr:helix-turn-helix domain-containing protein [Thermodesulforhabdus norvegica]SFM51906.1 protein RodZ, contains Xre-like HTH and DUF4115 domains [Thermodesulforhabdus norvegica]